MHWALDGPLVVQPLVLGCHRSSDYHNCMVCDTAPAGGPVTVNDLAEEHYDQLHRPLDEELQRPREADTDNVGHEPAAGADEGELKEQ